MVMIIISLLLIIGLPLLASANTLDTMEICAITEEQPFYNCDEKWIIVMYDTKYVDKNILGRAIYSEVEYVNLIIPPQLHIGNSDYRDNFGYTTLQHEIKHVQCRCNFHD